MPFEPKRAIFEPQALEYPLGKHLQEVFRRKGVPISYTTSHNRVTCIPGKNGAESFREGKQSLVVGVRRSAKFQTCRPSADYQLPLVTGCPGKCEYCYLFTNLGSKPYVRVYVNLDEILALAKEHLTVSHPAVVVFEGAATSDPLPVETYTGALAQTINFFGQEESGRFRFVTKFTDVDALLDLPHGGHTRFRFSINAEPVIKKYEHGTPDLRSRLAAARKVARAGYPLGFIIAPIFLEDDWQGVYLDLLDALREFVTYPGISLEMITHRFTSRAKSAIQHIFPQSGLPFEENSRVYKFGQFGYGKYVYEASAMKSAKEWFYSQAEEKIPGAVVEYWV